MQNQIDNNEIYNENEKERAFLISVDTGDFDALVSIKELEELADTAGAEVVGTSIQKRNLRFQNLCQDLMNEGML